MLSKRFILIPWIVACLGQTVDTNGFAASRNALVIGNSSYRPGYELRNPVADARAVARELSTLGFEVILVEDSDLATVQRALDAFVPKSIAGDAALIYYAGHGAMIDNRNFLLPIDFAMSNFSRVNEEALDTDRLMQALSSTHSKLKLLFFDACRNNPLESRGAKPLAERDEQASPSSNMLVTYSTAQGMTAVDGPGDHSPFAEELIAGLPNPDTEIKALVEAIRKHVRDTTDGRQTVWVQESLLQPFYLAVGKHSPGAVVNFAPPEPAETAAVPVFQSSDVVRLLPADLEGLDAAELRLARNEILARRGKRFEDADLATHFAKFAWYKPETFDPKLSALEQDNIALIRRYELLASAPKGGLLFGDSDRRLLTEADVSGLSKDQLRMARNEIYARRGRKFKRKEVRDYFLQFDWYRPLYGEVALTNIEQTNVDLIRKFE